MLSFIRSVALAVISFGIALHASTYSPVLFGMNIYGRLTGFHLSIFIANSYMHQAAKKLAFSIKIIRFISLLSHRTLAYFIVLVF